jgi:hypothetical protein
VTKWLTHTAPPGSRRMKSPALVPAFGLSFVAYMSDTLTLPNAVAAFFVLFCIGACVAASDRVSARAAEAG